MSIDSVNRIQIDGEEIEVVSDFIFLDSKIHMDDDCSHEIKRRLLLGRKAMTNFDKILNYRDIALSTKVDIIKAIGFSVMTYRNESCIIKRLNEENLMFLNCGVGRNC